MEKKLYRSSNDKMISGVCAGIAQYFNVDPTLVRIGAVILGFASFFTLILGYIVCAIVMPEKAFDEEEEDVEVFDKDGNKVKSGNQKKNSNLIGLFLIGLGCFWMLNKFVWWIDHDIYLGLGIVAIGLVILLSGVKKNQDKNICN
ncbi:MAG: hypothetical protein CVU84_05675 [Firmicutes bacterium HGW-Firmicutes-1]|jgi:phage shock protein C|nr:MAG: hypothetical protein CVU84_05675 [Firmicutes bacterium HGW-Firmicutes-1]